MGGITLTDDEQAAAPEDAPPPGPYPADAAGPGPRRVRLLLAALLLALLLAALQQTAVAGVLPAVTAELGGRDRTSWVITAHLLAVAVGLPVFGKLGDLHGRKGVFQTALVAFLAGSALAGWTHTVDQLIACRVLQGIGAGGLLAGAHALTADIVPARARARSLGALAAVLGLATATGPLLGAVLTEHTSWRWAFYANVPPGLLVLLAVGAALRLPEPPGREARGRFDVLGTLLLGAASTCLLLLASWGGTRYAWDSRVVLGLACGAAGTLLLFFVVESCVSEPLVPLRLLADRTLLVTAAAGAVTGLALAAAATCLPAHFRAVEGTGPTATALLMLPLPAGLVVACAAAGRLIGRTGHHRAFPVLGSAVAAVGLWLLSHVESGTPRLDHSMWQAVLGVGIGLVLPVLVLAVQHGAPPGDLGAATAAHLHLRLALGWLGAAALAASGAGRNAGPFTVPFTGPVTDRLADAGTMPRTFLLLVPVLVLGLFLACLLREKAPAPHPAPAAPTASVPPARTPGSAAAAAGPGRAAAPPAYGAVPVLGAVRHHDGSGVPHAVLTLVDGHGQQIGRGASGDDGRYALGVPGPGAYVLIASAAGHQPQAVTVIAGDRPVETDVVLGGAGRLAGTVVTADGTPVPDAAVTLTDVRGEVVAATRTGRDGDYVMTELVAGEYTLAAGAPSFRPAALPVSVQASRETRQIIELAGGAMLRGTVRATGGRPVEDARVTLLDAAGHVVDTLTTGPDGLFRFADLSSGAYTVIASGYPPVATVLQLAGGGRTERDLQLGHGD
ncbi:MFS transporter [Streptomyces sp. NPDC093595]|uniref:MFS transporter n=1 Tax=Streptomyces sp. NPDC093595 TaxID=3366045 RepID=UPI00380C276E